MTIESLDQTDQGRDFTLINNQLGSLDGLAAKGLYELITPANFPSLPAERVLVARFWTMNHVIEGLITIRNTVWDPDLILKLGSQITAKIQERDRLLAEGLSDFPDLPVDEEAIAGQAGFVQPGDFSRSMEMAIGLGLTEQLNPRNFPALRALLPKSLAFIRLQAVYNRLILLKAISRDTTSLGFVANERADPIDGKRLEEELRQAEKDFSSILKMYLADGMSPANSDQLPRVSLSGLEDSSKDPEKS